MAPLRLLSIDLAEQETVRFDKGDTYELSFVGVMVAGKDNRVRVTMNNERFLILLLSEH